MSPVTVILVERSAADQAIWTFSRNITSYEVGNITGLKIDASNVVDVISQTDASIEMSFDDPFNAGDPWTVNGAFGGITFTAGTILIPQSGSVST